MRPRNQPRWASLLAFSVAALLSAAQSTAQSATQPATSAAGAADEAPGYDRDIRPILADRCFTCHGPDPAARKGDLRLDSFEAATAARDGDAAITPGDLEHSEMWRRLTTEDPDDAMPPADSGRKPLSADERELVRRWIEAGAVYEPHWSFVPPQRPPVPTIAADGPMRTPVDAFVQAALARRSLEPGPEAAPEDLVRRLYLAVCGLPPTPEEVAAFVADPSPAAYDALVDRLLTEEPFRSRHAEHMAQPWLDAARYADTCGIHMDAGRQIWPWRDWVLRAYRDNKPFDEFVVEQLAGDLLEKPTLEQRVATGFHRNHVTTDEGGAINEEYLVEYAVDRTATTGVVFLGLTLGCARCHEHKYDPISHEDFYRVYAYFNSNEEPGLYSQRPDPNRALEPFLSVPSAEQTAARQRLTDEVAAARAALDTPSLDEAAEQAAFVADVQARAGVRWAAATVQDATSRDGATMSVQPDGSVKASGENPPRDAHTITLHTDAEDLRLLCLTALPDPDHDQGRVGRAENGNAVLSRVHVEAVSTADPTQRREVALVWAWASLEQQNGDYRVTNVLSDDPAGWAVDAHNHPAGPRTALLLADAPFGYPGGTELVVTLRYDSVYARHVFGRVALQVGAIGDTGLAMLPEAHSGWYVAGPFPDADPQTVWETEYGPEHSRTLVRDATFGGGAADGPARPGWRHEESFRDGVVNKLGNGSNATYVARRVLAPDRRQRVLSLGSDDGFRLFVDGANVAENQVDRGAAADQDRAEVTFAAGEHLLVMKIVNTGGVGGFYVRAEPRDGELDGVLVASLLDDAGRAALDEPLRTAWRLRYSPGYRSQQEHLTALEQQLAALDKEIPSTMVMQERPEPRKTYVLLRGEYDKPDRSREVRRGIPAALGRMPEDAPDNRLGLAQWLVADDNPLVARVAMNRLWAQLFGSGLVRTVDDFGMQGAWPSHPELLDWLAVEFRDSGWDLQHMLKTIVRSATFRQSARKDPAAVDVDPDNRLLAYFPRRRLTAEQLRDQALYTGGILVERFGGPSVKPYQPPGLWQEVAMVQSNTRTFQRGDGDDLFRRSLYTYYKRACPPPTMLLFDAPTREFCTTSRLSTNTPLQALALWNDEQFVEAARELAARTLRAADDDAARLRDLFERCTARAPDASTLQRATTTLARFRERYRTAPADADALLAVGTRPVPDGMDPAELAAWTMLTNAVLNLDATLCTP